MPQADKSSHRDKPKRPAAPNEDSHEKRGLIIKQAAERAWASVNKPDGGGLKKHANRHSP